MALVLSGCIDPSDFEHDDAHHEQHASTYDEDEACLDEAASETHEAHDHPVDPEEAFTDASPRYANEVDGREDSTRSIDIPLGTERLRVALVHDSDARLDLTVRDPLYRTWAQEETRGTKYTFEEEWLVVHDPLPGKWHLDIDIRGTSSYTIGFYLDD